MQRNKIGVLVMVVLVIISAIFGWKEYNRKNEPVKNIRPAFEVTAAELIKEFQENDSIPAKKYAGKLIAVSGTMKEAVKDDHGFFTLVLADTNAMYAIRCAMDSLYAAEVNTVHQGQTITIKGMFTGFQKDETGLLGSDIILNRCVIAATRKKN